MLSGDGSTFTSASRSPFTGGPFQVVSLFSGKKHHCKTRPLLLARVPVAAERRQNAPCVSPPHHTDRGRSLDSAQRRRAHDRMLSSCHRRRPGSSSLTCVLPPRATQTNGYLLRLFWQPCFPGAPRRPSRSTAASPRHAAAAQHMSAAWPGSALHTRLTVRCVRCSLDRRYLPVFPLRRPLPVRYAATVETTERARRSFAWLAGDVVTLPLSLLRLQATVGSGGGVTGANGSGALPSPLARSWPRPADLRKNGNPKKMEDLSLMLTGKGSRGPVVYEQRASRISDGVGPDATSLPEWKGQVRSANTGAHALPCSSPCCTWLTCIDGRCLVSQERQARV